MKTKLKKYVWNKYAIGLVALTPSVAFADSGDAISTVLNGLIGLLQSGPARAIGVIAIIGIGYMTIHEGKIPKGKAIAAVLGIGIIFGAVYIAGKLGYGPQ